MCVCVFFSYKTQKSANYINQQSRRQFFSFFLTNATEYFSSTAKILHNARRRRDELESRLHRTSWMRERDERVHRGTCIAHYFLKWSNPPSPLFLCKAREHKRKRKPVDTRRGRAPKSERKKQFRHVCAATTYTYVKLIKVDGCEGSALSHPSSARRLRESRIRWAEGHKYAYTLYIVTSNAPSSYRFSSSYIAHFLMFRYFSPGLLVGGSVGRGSAVTLKTRLVKI